MAKDEMKSFLLGDEDFQSFDGLELKLQDNNNYSNQSLNLSPKNTCKFLPAKYLPLLSFLCGFFLIMGLLYISTIFLSQGWLAVSFLQNSKLNATPSLEYEHDCTSEICLEVAQEIGSWLNISVDPCENFYEYACGGWIHANPIPVGESSWNVMSKLAHQNREIITRLLEEPIQSESSQIGGADKAKTFYESCIVAKDNDLTDDPWRVCYDETEKFFGMALGAMYMHNSFHSKRKQKAHNMVSLVRQELVKIVQNLDWMDHKTRSKSLRKVNNLTYEIGYSDQVSLDDEYKDVDVFVWDYDKNYDRLFTQFYLNALQSDMGILKRVLPQTVHAFYNFENDQIVIPAGILQRPFYHPGLPESVNFGGIGVAMGHALFHCFDEGFDQDGPQSQLNGWWSRKTVKQFKERATCLISEYSSMEMQDQQLNGRQTLDENVADQGGILAAFRAYHQRHSKRGQKLAGLELTLDQAFFVSYAQTWCSASIPEAVTRMIRNETHAPDSIRVLGALQNLAEFSNAFQCPLNSPMNPLNKCLIW